MTAGGNGCDPRPSNIKNDRFFWALTVAAIGMVAEDALGAVELLGEQPAHQHVRPGCMAEGECEVRLSPHDVVEAISAADREDDFAHPVVAPIAKSARQLCAGDRLSAFVKRHQTRTARHR